MKILAIDPGKEKCGIAVIDSKHVIYKAVVAKDEYIGIIKELSNNYDVEQIVLGDGTGSKEFFSELKTQFPELGINIIDESHSTEEARDRYWQFNPAKGIRRIVPNSMQVPPEPYDEYVAIILAERYLKKND